jgi:pimeloyl-ACP methyl ester carboxylesterase
MYFREVTCVLFTAVLCLTSACATPPKSTSTNTNSSTPTTRIIPLEQARKTYATEYSRFVDAEGVEIHYKDQGEGPAVLLIHGTLGDTADWDGWTNTLSENYRVIRFDLPGFGLSGDMKNGNYSIDRSLSIIDALMDHLGEERFAIAGISYGGIVTFRYAATRSDRVKAMILVNSAGIQAGKPLKREDKPKQKPKPARRGSFMESPVVLKEDIETFYEGYINDPEARTTSFIQRKLDFLNIVGRDDIAIKARALYERGNPQRVLKHVKAPSAVLWGQGNRALDLDTANAFIDALENACYSKLITFESGGHYINVEKPEQTVAAAKAFLDEVIPSEAQRCL